MPRLEKKIKIRNFETDIKGHCSVPVMADLFQGIAEEHAEMLGLGYKDMSRENMVWVLSRMSINVLEFPPIGKELILETLPIGVDRLFALRDYSMKTEDKTYISATSAWIIINMESRRPLKPDSHIAKLGIDLNKAPNSETPGKIVVPENHSRKSNRSVKYSDLDINNHMNNGQYFRWILDLFSPEIFMHKSVSSATINYNNELFYGDDVELFSGESSPSIWTIWGVAKGRNAFSAQIKWN